VKKINETIEKEDQETGPPSLVKGKVSWNILRAGDDTIEDKVISEAARVYRENFNNLSNYGVCFSCESNGGIKRVTAQEVFKNYEYVPLEVMDYESSKLPNCSCCSRPYSLYHTQKGVESYIRECLEREAWIATLIQDCSDRILGVAFGYISTLSEILYLEWRKYPFTHEASAYDKSFDYEKFVTELAPAMGTLGIECHDSMKLFCGNCVAISKPYRDGQQLDVVMQLMTTVEMARPDLLTIGEVKDGSVVHTFIEAVGGIFIRDILEDKDRLIFIVPMSNLCRQGVKKRSMAKGGPTS